MPSRPTTKLAGGAKLIHEAVVAHRQGKTDLAIDLARRARSAAGVNAVDADVIIAEALFRSARIDELRVHLEGAAAFKGDRRWALMMARAERSAGGDGARAEALFLEVLKPGLADPVDRMAAFELVKMYEKAGRHDEAWTIASGCTRTTEKFDADKLVRELEATARAAEAGKLAKARRATRAAHRAAFIYGMPRSGTTLIEQMLDCHSLIRGVGELNIHGDIEAALRLEGASPLAGLGTVWPDAAFNISTRTLDHWQGEYRRATRDFHKLSSNVWTLDKTVFPGLKPYVFGPVFPGCKVICVRRDARDNAVSLFLNNLNTDAGWTSSLESIRRVMEAQRKCSMPVFKALGIETVDVRLEDLVESPEGHARAMIAHLGLEWEPACLHPERNARVVHTLSHEQVRRPINKEGMGRWKKHASRFEAFWDELG